MLKNPETRFSGFAVKTSSDPGFFLTHSLEVFYENFIMRGRKVWVWVRWTCGSNLVTL
jgi:hypothetical protein